MPLFAAFLGSLFSALGLFLAKIFAAKLALRLIGVTAITGLSAGLMFMFNTMIAPLVQAAFTTSYGQFLGLAFPPIAGTVLATYFAAWLAVQTYRLKVRAVALTTNI